MLHHRCFLCQSAGRLSVWEVHQRRHQPPQPPLKTPRHTAALRRSSQVSLMGLNVNFIYLFRFRSLIWIDGLRNLGMSHSFKHKKPVLKTEFLLYSSLHEYLYLLLVLPCFLLSGLGFFRVEKTWKIQSNKPEISSKNN